VTVSEKTTRNSAIGRTFVVGMIFLSFYFLAFASFRIAAFVLVADLVAVGIWRAFQPDTRKGWYAIRRKWLDLVTIFTFAAVLLALTLIVPIPS
jgi:hypothetical protein